MTEPAQAEGQQGVHSDDHPHGQPIHEPWIERVLRESIEAGDFDELPGSGKPFTDLHRHYEPTWWARKFLERERLTDQQQELAEQIRQQLPRLLATGGDDAKEGLEALNARIAEVNDKLPVSEHTALLDIPDLMRRAKP